MSLPFLASLCHKGAAVRQVDAPVQTGADAQLALQFNEMWFADPTGGEPLTFREIFLKSEALENVVVGKLFRPGLID